MIYDVIIVGGGPAGSATALSLVRSDPDASFLLLDDADPASFKIGESLPGMATRTLRYLSDTFSSDLLQETELGRHSRCTGNASAWTSQEIHEQYAIMNPYGMGWHLDRALFDQSVRDTVRDLCQKAREDESSAPSSIERARFLSVEKEEDTWHVYCEELGSRNVKCYHSKWVVDATGRKASLARKLGAETIKSDSLLAFYSLFSGPPGEDVDDRTFIEASESGWWYTSRLPNGTRVVVYHTDDDDPSSKLSRRQEGFLDLLHNHTEHISRIILESDYNIVPNSRFPRCTAAGSSCLQPICDEANRWCAVGDAAMAFDPLSSQGIITALSLGCFIGDEISKRIGKRDRSEEFRDISDYFRKVREKYEKEKKYFYNLVQQFDSGFWKRRQR